MIAISDLMGLATLGGVEAYEAAPRENCLATLCDYVAYRWKPVAEHRRFHAPVLSDNLSWCVQAFFRQVAEFIAWDEQEKARAHTNGEIDAWYWNQHQTVQREISMRIGLVGYSLQQLCSLVEQRMQAEYPQADTEDCSVRYAPMWAC